MTKYEKLAKELESSGLTNKAFALKKGIGASTVSYYLKRHRDQSAGVKSHEFKKVALTKTKGQFIRIKTSGGIEIEIPA